MPREDSLEGDFIEVAAVFKKGTIDPRFFILKGCKVGIEKINFYWKERNGESVLHHFSVSSGDDIYHIYFDNRSFLWRIKSLE